MTDFRQATDADLDAPPANAEFRAAEPLKTAGVEFTPDEEAAATGVAGATQAIRDGGAKLTAQATDKARLFADQGKAKAGETLDQFSQMLTEAAGTVDDKIGAQYGQYARSAAEQVTNFSNSLKAKDVDELMDDVRGFVRASPAVAIGVAAALGFALARLVQSGLDAGSGDTKA